MYYIKNNILYTSPNIKFAEIYELNKRNLKKLILKKDVLTFSTYCFREAKKRQLKELLKDEDIKRMIEAKKITYDFKYLRYHGKSYLILHLYIISASYEFSKISFGFEGDD
ncbi:MAG: hypothetical protein MJH09_05795 [Cetobacterium sp.]|nr:hypothetical protein [Cetobacterium sp.]